MTNNEITKTKIKIKTENIKIRLNSKYYQAILLVQIY